MEGYFHYLPAKLTSFRFKIKSKTLPVAAFLAKQGKREPECKMCGEEKEDLHHFLVNCRVLEREREQCLEVAGLNLGQQLEDWLMQNGSAEGSATHRSKVWQITQQVYNMWKVRVQQIYKDKRGDSLSISMGQPPNTTTPHHSSTHPPMHSFPWAPQDIHTTIQLQTDTMGARTNLKRKRDVSNQLTESHAQPTVPRVNGPYWSKAPT